MFSLLHKESETLLHPRAGSPIPNWSDACVCAEPAGHPRQATPTTPCLPHLRLASRFCSDGALSTDWVLETEDTLELRMKPNAASLAAGRREYPGGRSPDFCRPDLAAFELEAFFKSVKMNPKQNKTNLS